jgi:dolichol-phosphate mannosyltransferase
MTNSGRSTLYVLVPVFNEAPNLGRLFQSFTRLQHEFGAAHRVNIVMVDDGSSDDTVGRAAELGSPFDLVILQNPTNQGPGAAFALGFAYLAQRLNESDWVLTLEGDNTSRYELIRQLFRRSEEGYDVILASPYMYGGGIVNTAPLRVLMSHLANAFVKELLGAHGLLTMSSFFRLYRASVLLKLQAYYGPGIVERAGFECMVEMLLKMIYLKTTISEVPMVLDTSLRVGASKMKVMRTVRGYLALGRRTTAWRTIAERPPVSQVAAQPVA